MLVSSFILSGEFAAFKDPSVTTNQVVYNIPSKSSIIGIIAAITGIKRSHTFDQLYSTDFVDLLRKIQVGVQLLSEPKKITYYTNHRSLKQSKTKPFKKEVLQHPNYRIFLASEQKELIEDIFYRITNNNFEFMPYLGHAYCPARISDPHLYSNCTEVSSLDDQHGTEIEFETPTVVLDESENYDNNFEVLRVEPLSFDSTILIERHLYHFVVDAQVLEKRVLKFWIPVNNAYSFYLSKKPSLSKIMKVDSEGDLIVCFY